MKFMKFRKRVQNGRRPLRGMNLPQTFQRASGVCICCNAHTSSALINIIIVVIIIIVSIFVQHKIKSSDAPFAPNSHQLGAPL